MGLGRGHFHPLSLEKEERDFSLKRILPGRSRHIPSGKNGPTQSSTQSSVSCQSFLQLRASSCSSTGTGLPADLAKTKGPVVVGLGMPQQAQFPVEGCKRNACSLENIKLKVQEEGSALRPQLEELPQDIKFAPFVVMCSGVIGNIEVLNSCTGFPSLNSQSQQPEIHPGHLKWLAYPSSASEAIIYP